MQRSRFSADEWICTVQEDITMGKSAPSPPPAPDPVATAAAQASSNVDTSLAQGAENRVNQITPYGDLIYNQTGSQTLPNGQVIPTFTANVSLSPAQQQALNSQQSLSESLLGLANNETGRVSSIVSQPFDTSQIPALPTNPSGIDQNATNTVFNAEMDLLNPQFKQQQQNLDDTLAHEGIQPDNQAALTEQQNFQNTENVAKEQAASQAIAQGAQLGAQEFGQQTQANQNALQEENFLREQPLNEAIALESGTQIQNPSFTNTPQTGVAPTDVLGAVGLNQGARNVAYQGQVAAANSNNSATAGLAGAAIGAAAIF